MRVQIAHVSILHDWAPAVGHVAHTRLMRIQARQQTRPRRTTPAGVVKLREPHPACGKRIEIGCVDFAAVAADVAEADIVGEDDDDVGAGASGSRRLSQRRSARRPTDISMSGLPVGKRSNDLSLDSRIPLHASSFQPGHLGSRPRPR